MPPLPLAIALVPLKCSSRNLQFPHRVPFAKEKMPWCPCPFKNEAYSPVTQILMDFRTEAFYKAFESAQSLCNKGVLFFHYSLATLTTNLVQFSQVCYFMHMLRHWSLTTPIVSSAFNDKCTGVLYASAQP